MTRSARGLIRCVCSERASPVCVSRASTRLVRVEENGKFQREPRDSDGPADPDAAAKPENLRAFVHKLKSELGVKKVLVWHALGGYCEPPQLTLAGTASFKPA